MRIPVPLDALRAFEAAARHLSIKDAALELAVTPSAAGRQLRTLEDLLGVYARVGSLAAAPEGRLAQLDHEGKICRNEVYFARSDWMTRMGAASKRDQGRGP
ncbi:LysR family transcriptional regulator [Bordetella ansorpii]|uniref:LysR family transcriptional regulator n=1 Tax=Bordetella ansorpii TaxID=288768 RepID=A0A157SHZ1_9BORD|nr:LysR family transcriptional regulator [Bordetella ansorpii]